MKSWYHQTHKGYGQLDAETEQQARAKIIAWGLCRTEEQDFLEVWEATPTAPHPSLPWKPMAERRTRH